MDFARDGIIRAQMDSKHEQLNELKSRAQELSVLKSELASSKRRVFVQQQNSNVFFLSSRDSARARLDSEMVHNRKMTKSIRSQYGDTSA